jgi:hypothetical protein
MPPPRDNEGLEVVGAKVGEQFEHRLINHFGIKLAGLRMLRRRDPVTHGPGKFLGGHAGMGGRHQLGEARLTRRRDAMQVAFEQRGEWFLRFPFGMVGREGLDSIHEKEDLCINRLLRP